MPTQLLAKLLEITYNEVQTDLKEHEKEDRLVDNLLGKSLSFSTKESDNGMIEFHSIGAGKREPSSVVTLQVRGTEFDQDSTRLTRDLRYIYYKTHGYAFFSGTPTNFLVTPPLVKKLGSSNILIEFVIYGDSIYRVNRCLAIFAKVIKKHQGDLHQTAIEQYDNDEVDADGDSNISLEEPISEEISEDNFIEYTLTATDDEVYIKEYAKYLDDESFREIIDDRSTFAESKLK